MRFPEFVLAWTTKDFRRVDLHAYRRGEGGVRDENHIRDIVACFRRGNEDMVSDSEPDADDIVLFEIKMAVSETRRGGSNYSGYDYRRFPRCPQCVAEAGMDIWRQVKALLKAARITSDKEKKEKTK